MKKTSKPSKISQTKQTQNLTKEIRHLAESERSLELELARELKALSKEVKNIRSMEVIKIFRHPWKFLGLSLVKGIMVGFGSVLGATVFLSIFLYLLAQISFVPIVGEFVQEVMGQIEQTATPSSETKDSNIFERYHQAQEDIESQEVQN